MSETIRMPDRNTLGAQLQSATKTAIGPASAPPSPPLSRAGTERKPQRLVIRTAANRFDIPLDEIPEGMTYEWKVMTVYNQPATEAITNWKLNGWKEVPAGRHPSFTNASPDSQEAIIRGGQVLCERPIEVTRMAREMDRQAAADQVNSQLERLQLRAKHTESTRVTKLKQQYEAIIDEE